MLWNHIVKSSVSPFFARRGVFARLLCPAAEKHEKLFGKYEFHMDLSLGRLQKILFLKPETYEPETQQALRERLGPGKTALDIGANSGYFSVLMADAVGPSGHVYSFEPVPVSYALLEKNIRVNHLTQIEAVPLALSDRAGSAELHLHPTNDGGHSLGTLEEVGETITVKTVTLDHFLESRKIGKIAVVKIDVEGAEPLVFAGAKRLLSGEDAPDILCEVSDLNQSQTGGSERALRESLYAHGYRSFSLDPPGQEIRPETPVRGLVNLLFTKRA